MSYSVHMQRLVRAGISAAAVGVAFAGAPALASASPVDLGTAAPFVVLGGATVTNTGPSVLNGELGVSPGTALTGFNAATVNGATHDNDAVAGQAQSDVTNAYGVAAGQQVTADLSGSDLGGLTLTSGAYRFSSDALLTGTLRLNAQNDPAAQFVFQIGTALTTATASRVVLMNGASPCHVFWQIGSSATLGTSTSFMGNVLAAASISLEDSAKVQGRLFARSGQVSLINNVIDGSMCGTSTSAPPVGPPTPPTSGTGGGSGSGSGGTPPASGTTVETRNGTAVWKRSSPHPRAGQPSCTAGFTATLTGAKIKSVVYRLDGRIVHGSTKSPFKLFVRAAPGKHRVTARVTFKDATRTKTLKLAYRACAAVVLRPTFGPSRFTG